MMMDRKQFLFGTGFLSAGAALGFWGRGRVEGDPNLVNEPKLIAPGPSSRPPNPSVSSVVPEPRGVESFSQCGEDVNIDFLFRFLGIREVTYLDVGANHPFELSNTYFFYRKNHQGVLVEPNVSLCELLREARPRDTTLVAGIGMTSQKEADYYIMNFPALNTFSKEEADHQEMTTNGRIKVQRVIKMPLLDINDVMEANFKEAPTFLSVDTEGLDYKILKSIDYSRFRPKVICAETLLSSTTKRRPEIGEFMTSQGYVERGGSIVNTIFIDSKIL